MADTRWQKRDRNQAVHQKAINQQQGCYMCPMRRAYHEYEGLYYRPYNPNLKRRFDYDRELPTCPFQMQSRKGQ